MTISLHLTWWWLWGALSAVYGLIVSRGILILFVYGSWSGRKASWRDILKILFFPVALPLIWLSASFVRPW